MFDDNFSFDVQRSSSLDSGAQLSVSSCTSRSVSPCSPVTCFPPPQFSVTDLAAQFAGQRIAREAQICYDRCIAYANTADADDDWTIPPPDADCDVPAPVDTLSRASTLSLSGASLSASRRSQRQRSARLLCTASHHRDIAKLVARMVDTHDQCCLQAAPGLGSPSAGTVSPPLSPPLDEGYDSGLDGEGIFAHAFGAQAAANTAALDGKPRASGHQRSSDTATGACVSKASRFRRERLPRRVRSGEVAQ